MTLGFAALAWQIPYQFNWMFGAPWVVPVDAATAESGFLTGPRYWELILWSGDRGWLVWSPLVQVGLAGLAGGLLFTRRRSWALLLGAVVVAQVVVTAGVRDWYAGESFGMRRLTELFPVIAVGVSAVLQAVVVGWQHGGGWRGLSVLGTALVVGLTAYGAILVVAQPLFGYFTDPSFGFVTTPPYASAENVLKFLFFDPPKFDLIWPMMEHHFGPWAWTWPGP